MVQEGVIKQSRAAFFKQETKKEKEKKKARILKETIESEAFTPERFKATQTSYLNKSKIKAIKEDGIVKGYTDPEKQQSVLLTKSQTSERFKRTIGEMQEKKASAIYKTEQAKVKSFKKGSSLFLKAAGQELKSQYQSIKKLSGEGLTYASSVIKRDYNSPFKRESSFLSELKTAREFAIQTPEKRKAREEKFRVFSQSYLKEVKEKKVPLYKETGVFLKGISGFVSPKTSILYKYSILTKASTDIKRTSKSIAQNPLTYVTAGSLGVQAAEMYLFAKAPQIIKKIGNVPDEIAYKIRVKKGKKFFAEPKPYTFSEVDDVVFVTQRPPYISPVKNLPSTRRAALANIKPQTTLSGRLVSEQKIKFLRSDVAPELYGQRVFIKKTEVFDKSVTLWDFTNEGKLLKSGAGTQEGYLKFLKSKKISSLDDLAKIPKSTGKVYTYKEFSKPKPSKVSIKVGGTQKVSQVVEKPFTIETPKEILYDYTKYDKLAFETVSPKSTTTTKISTPKSVTPFYIPSYNIKPSKKVFPSQSKIFQPSEIKQTPKFESVVGIRSKVTPREKQIPVFESVVGIRSKVTPREKQIPIFEQKSQIKQSPIYKEKILLLPTQRITQKQYLKKKERQSLFKFKTGFEIKKTPSEIPFNYSFNFEPKKEELDKKKRKKLNIKSRIKYLPSVEAAAFNIRGRKPSRSAISSGLGLRPIIS